MIGGEAEWWYEADGEARGPVPARELRSMIAAGALGSGSLVTPQGESEWGTVGDYAIRLGLDESERATGGVGLAPPPSGSPLAPSAVLAPTPEAPAPPLASVFARFGAYFLDLLLMPMTLYVGWIIWSIIIWPKGLSPGKQILRLRVINVGTRQPPGRATMALRELAAKHLLQVLSWWIITIVSGFMVLFSDTRQATWDKMVGTVVVDEGAGQPERTGWVLVGAFFSFLIAVFGWSPEGDMTVGALVFSVVWLALSAALAVAGIASLFRRGRGRRSGPSDAKDHRWR